MQPIYKSSAFTFIVLILLLVLRSFDLETQKTAYQLLILWSIATATLSAGILATRYFAIILSKKRGSRKKQAHLGG